VLDRELPDDLVLNLDAVHRRDHEQAGVHGPQRRPHVSDEVRVPGSIEDVQLRVAPLDRCQGEGDADLPLDLLGLEVADGVAVLDGPHAGGHASQEEEGFGERRLAAPSVTDEQDVADVAGVVGVQGSAPRVGGSRL
jgi:hypothetical protein